MEYLDVLKNRKTIRRFGERQIKKDILKEIINEARMSPSWVNTQERKVYIATKNVVKSIREEYVKRAEKNAIGVSDF